MKDRDNTSSGNTATRVRYIGKYKEYPTRQEWDEALSIASWDDSKTFYKIQETFDGHSIAEDASVQELYAHIVDCRWKQAATKFVLTCYDIDSEEEFTQKHKELVERCIDILKEDK